MKKTLKNMTERELRNAKVPYIKTEKELTRYIRTLASRPHDYGTCVYAVSMASVATYNYMANQLGITGFQSGCADLDIIRRTRNIENFRIINYDDLLYPQIALDKDKFPSLPDLLYKNGKWLREDAIKLLKENKGNHIHPNVRRWWRQLSKLKDPKDDRQTRKTA